jgi:hypothetical protein
MYHAAGFAASFLLRPELSLCGMIRSFSSEIIPFPERLLRRLSEDYLQEGGAE